MDNTRTLGLRTWTLFLDHELLPLPGEHMHPDCGTTAAAVLQRYAVLLEWRKELEMPFLHVPVPGVFHMYILSIGTTKPVICIILLLIVSLYFLLSSTILIEFPASYFQSTTLLAFFLPSPLFRLSSPTVCVNTSIYFAPKA